MGQVPLLGQGEPFGQSVEAAAELDRPQQGLEFGDCCGIGWPQSWRGNALRHGVVIAADPIVSGALERAVQAATDAESAGRTLIGPHGEAAVVPAGDVRRLAPVPRPPLVRDYLTYEAHANGARPRGSGSVQ